MTPEEYEQALSDLDAFDDELDDLESELNDDEDLKHYASPYYDPVKAHEYYMKTRELKGKSPTATLNAEGKQAARYVKQQLNGERKTKVQTHRDQTNNTITSLREQKKATVEAFKTEMQGKIAGLRAKLKGMSKVQKSMNREKIYSEIASLRDENKAERTRLQEEYSASSKALRTAHKDEKTRLKTEYDEKYAQELAKIQADPQFTKRKKRSRK